MSKRRWEKDPRAMIPRNEIRRFELLIVGLETLFLKINWDHFQITNSPTCYDYYLSKNFEMEARKNIFLSSLFG